MSTAGFILVINLSLAALFAIAFLIIALASRADRAPRWFAVGYGFGLFYVLSEFILPIQTSPRFAAMVGFTSFLGAVASVLVGIAVRYRQAVPWLWLTIFLVASVALNWFTFDMGRNSALRLYAYQAPYALLQFGAAWLIWRSRRRELTDIGLLSLLFLSGLQFILKPAVAQWMGGVGDAPQSYISTIYALYSQSLGAILQVALGLLMLMLLVRDMLIEVTERSETDPLSGLLNRRGFEGRAHQLLAAGQSNVPLSLIASDLDAFKSINDSYGHDAGDEVITGFARLLTAETPGKAIVGRMGGEEFVVLLPRTSLVAARQYAEALRTALAGQAFTSVSADLQVTASFGVAEFDGRESLSDLRRRADAALYVSKRDGRNRVSAASPEPVRHGPDKSARSA